MGVGGQRHAPAALPPEKRPGVRFLGSWVEPTVCQDGCGKSRPTGTRSPDRPACSESLYRLICPAHHIKAANTRNTWNLSGTVDHVWVRKCLDFEARMKSVIKRYLIGFPENCTWLVDMWINELMWLPERFWRHRSRREQTDGQWCGNARVAEIHIVYCRCSWMAGEGGVEKSILRKEEL
jgi:hypothetical protein